MDGIAATGAKAIEAVNQVLKNTTTETMKAAEKQMKVTVSTAIGAEVGKGSEVDLSI